MSCNFFGGGGTGPGVCPTPNFIADSESGTTKTTLPAAPRPDLNPKGQSVLAPIFLEGVPKNGLEIFGGGFPKMAYKIFFYYIIWCSRLILLFLFI